MRWQRKESSRDCEYVGKCWYDGSGLNAGPVMTKFMRSGPGALWRELEDYYVRIFETPDDEKTIDDVGFGQLLNAMTGPSDEKSA